MSLPLAGRALIAALIASLALAACGSSDNSSSTTAAAPATTTAASGDTVSVADSDIGKVLVGPSGHTLYMFDKDEPNKSNCSGDCVAAWPPLTNSGSATAGAGVSSAKLGTSDKANANQVTYNGHPLYYYAEDEKPGQTNGQKSDEFGAEWYALAPSGAEIEKSNPSGSSDSGSSGYNY